MRVILWLFLFLSIHQLYAQVVTLSHKHNREIGGYYDNDIFFITDQYYTSGIDLNHARLVDANSFLKRLLPGYANDSSKIILRYHYGHKIFTPLKIRERDLSERDRPYAGWHYIKAGISLTKSERFSNEIQLIAGLIGEQSGIGNFQKWYHKNTGITAPLGWENQIENLVIFQLEYSFKHLMPISKLWDFIGQPEFTLGNMSPGIGYQFVSRIGRMNGLNNSGFNGTRLSHELPEIGQYDSKQEEAYLFVGIRGDYIFHNALIEGRIVEPKSTHIESIEPFVITQIFGGTYSTYYTTFTIEIRRLSKEVQGGESHRFVRFSLAYRF